MYRKNKMAICLLAAGLVLSATLLPSCFFRPIIYTFGGYHWPRSAAEIQKLDSAKLDQALEAAEATGYMHSLLVVRNGFIVAEGYFDGYTEFDPHIARSVTKSVMSTVIGLAIDQEYLTLDDHLMDFFPEYQSESLDPRKYDITIEHLLTMTAGFDWDENIWDEVYNSDNWVESTINLPLIADPGTTFSYNTFGYHLLSAILARASELSAWEFATVYLADPASFEIPVWAMDPQGVFFGGSDLYMTPRDMARFGYLFSREGRVDRTQVVPSAWFESASESAWTSSSSWGVLDEYGYGYGWWTGSIDGEAVVMAIGHGGQYVVIFPRLEMVVVTTSEAYLDWDEADQHERKVLDIIANYVLTAVME